MRIYKERGRRAQRLASTKKLAGTLHSAASSDPKSHSFSTHPQSGEGWVEKLVKEKANRIENRPALTYGSDTISGKRNRNEGGGPNISIEVGQTGLSKSADTYRYPRRDRRGEKS